MNLTLTMPDADNLPLILEEADMEKIPGNLYLARALRLSDGSFHAVYSSPTTSMTTVQQGGKPRIFGREDLAERAALYELFDALNVSVGDSPGYVAKAERSEVGSGYIAIWSAPGFNPGMLRMRPSRVPMTFHTVEDAELAAMRHVLEVLNKPRMRAITYKPERYIKLTAAQFAEELRLAGVTPSFFAYMYGTSQRRVIEWIDGKEDVPHPARLLLALFQADPENIDTAEEVTKNSTEARQPAKQEVR